MDRQATINCVIPDIDATFIGTKGCDGFAEVAKDFENANEVRILTYSRIGYEKRKNEKLRALQTLREDTKLRIVIALPGAKNLNNAGKYDSNRYTEESIKNELDKITSLIDTRQYLPKDVEIYICFKNHAKIIGTENVLYVGSANYNDFSCKNYEAGMLIKDKCAIRRIYNEYFDNIVAVRYYSNGLDTIGINVASLISYVEDFVICIEDFVCFFPGKDDAIREMKDIYDKFLERVKEIKNLCNKYWEMLEDTEIKDKQEYGAFFKFAECFIFKVIDDMDGIIDNLESLHDSSMEKICSEYGRNIDYASRYDSYHMDAMGVYAPDGLREDGTPYVHLWEEAEQEDYISDYWTEEWNNNEAVNEIRETLDSLTEEINNIINSINNNPKLKQLGYQEELAKLFIIQQGTDDSVIK